MKKRICLILIAAFVFAFFSRCMQTSSFAIEDGTKYKDVEKVSLSDLDLLSPDERDLFLVQLEVALLVKSEEMDGKVYVYLPGEKRANLASLSVDNLQLLKKHLTYLSSAAEATPEPSRNPTSNASKRIAEIVGQVRAVESGVTPSIAPREEPRVDALDGLDIEPCVGSFANEKDLQFSLFKSVYEVTDQLDWLVTPLVTRDGNPELSFDPKKQEIKHARFYLTYYGNVDKDEAKGNVEEYTERLAAVLSVLYPNIDADMVCFFWKIPVISKDSLHSASFFYHTENGVLVRNDE